MVVCEKRIERVPVRRDALLIMLIVLAIGANALIGRLGRGRVTLSIRVARRARRPAADPRKRMTESASGSDGALPLPAHRGIYRGGAWHEPAAGGFVDTINPSTGGALGTVAVAVKHEVVLAIVGGLFVLETVSVIVQVVSFKLTGKRVFRMAPIHHHFEQLGWKEPTIVIRFWIVAVILALIGLSTLKLR